MALTRTEKNLIKAYLKDSYTAIQIRADGCCYAQKAKGAPFGVLYSPAGLRAAVDALKEREAANKQLRASVKAAEDGYRAR